MNQRRALGILLIASCALPAGCSSSGHSFTGPGYRHPFYSYSVSADDDALLLSEEWEIDNYRWDGSAYVEKTQSDYQIALRVDLDEDGQLDWADMVRLYDLRFRHRRTASILSVQTVPLSTRNGDLELRVLAEMYLEASSGADRRLYRFDRGLAVSERRYAPRVLSERAVAVAGRPAWEVTYERVNVERDQVDPQTSARREKLVLVRAGMPFAHRYDSLFTLPTVMVFHLSAPDHAFADVEGALASLFARISWADTMLPEVREAVLGCTERDIIGFATSGQETIVHGLTGPQTSCIEQTAEGLEPGSYSFSRPYEPPAPEPAAAPDPENDGDTADDDPAPEGDVPAAP